MYHQQQSEATLLVREEDSTGLSDSLWDRGVRTAGPVEHSRPGNLSIFTGKMSAHRNRNDSVDYVSSLDATFGNVLNDHDGWWLFYEFLRCSDMALLLDCLQQISSFKRCDPNSNAFFQTAKGLYGNYVANVDSRLPITYDARRRVMEKFRTNQLDPSTFDEIEQPVLSQLNHFWFPLFVKSSFYSVYRSACVSKNRPKSAAVNQETTSTSGLSPGYVDPPSRPLGRSTRALQKDHIPDIPNFKSLYQRTHGTGRSQQLSPEEFMELLLPKLIKLQQEREREEECYKGLPAMSFSTGWPDPHPGMQKLGANFGVHAGCLQLASSSSGGLPFTKQPAEHLRVSTLDDQPRCVPSNYMWESSLDSRTLLSQMNAQAAAVAGATLKAAPSVAGDSCYYTLSGGYDASTMHSFPTGLTGSARDSQGSGLLCRISPWQQAGMERAAMTLGGGGGGGSLSSYLQQPFVSAVVEEDSSSLSCVNVGQESLDWQKQNAATLRQSNPYSKVYEWVENLPCVYNEVSDLVSLANWSLQDTHTQTSVNDSSTRHTRSEVSCASRQYSLFDRASVSGEMDRLAVTYYLGSEPIPYRCWYCKPEPLTLAIFKSIVGQKGSFRYFFKVESGNDAYYEEVWDESCTLPLHSGQVVGKLKRVKSPSHTQQLPQQR